MPYKTKFLPKKPTKYIGDHDKIICRSLWERKFCKFLDENVNIIKWSFETLRIPYLSPIDNEVHIYLPDFIVEKKNKMGTIETLVVEIKPYKQTKEPKVGKRKSKKSLINENITYAINTTKWRAAKEFCDKHSWKFVILTEKELFDGNR
jgi:hypothetical protein|tara:strand:+ start:2955 stop:3401 length:447 start_codon:yes stop_codon:yes gene_type:complete